MSGFNFLLGILKPPHHLTELVQGSDLGFRLFCIYWLSITRLWKVSLVGEAEPS